MFDWYSTSRLVVIVGHFEHRVAADSTGERWRWTLLDLAYWNICFNLKQLIKELHCDLQVNIHQGLAEVQADILKAIENSNIKVTTLSAWWTISWPKTWYCGNLPPLHVMLCFHRPQGDTFHPIAFQKARPPAWALGHLLWASILCWGLDLQELEHSSQLFLADGMLSLQPHSGNSLFLLLSSFSMSILM